MERVWVVEHRQADGSWTPIHPALSWHEADRFKEHTSKSIRPDCRITTYTPEGADAAPRKPPTGESVLERNQDA